MYNRENENKLVIIVNENHDAPVRVRDKQGQSEGWRDGERLFSSTARRVLNSDQHSHLLGRPCLPLTAPTRTLDRPQRRPETD